MVAGVVVRPFDDLAAIVREHGVAIGVIATPAAAAQDVADRMVESGITSRDLLAIIGLDGVVEWISETATDMLGRQPEELIGTNAFDFVHPDDVGIAASAFAVKRPVDSMTTSAPTDSQSSFSGSRSAKTLNSSPATEMPASVARTS